MLRNEGFKPTLADADLWIRDAGDVCEHVCICVDDAIFVGKEPDSFCNNLKNICGCKLKGVEEPSYHLGGNFGCDQDGTLHCGAKTCIEKIMKNCERKNGSKPKKQNRPMDKDDHPELDDSTLLDATGTKECQSLIGALQ